MTVDQHMASMDDILGKGESILVVDDVQEQREIASEISCSVEFIEIPQELKCF